jgi:type II secretory pathway pseudopilin PulG
MRTINATRPVLDASAVSKTSNAVPMKCSPRGLAAFTLAEVVVCIAIVALMFGGIITAYMQGAYRAEWAGYNLAAQALAMQQIEQAKTAMWDDTHNEFTNILLQTWAVMDLPRSGANVVYATNYIQVTANQISTSPLLSVYMVKVDTVWPYIRKGLVNYYTNTVADYYAPDDQPQ